MPSASLDARAVLEANKRLWDEKPELHRRQLTMSHADAKNRQDWMRHYRGALQSTAKPPPPRVQPHPVTAPPPPTLPDSPVVLCGVRAMTHEQKMEMAIKRAHEQGFISNAVLDELPSIAELVVGIVVVGGILAGLGVAAGAAASTGVGAVLEAIAAAIVLTLAAVGVITSAVQIKDGIVALMEFNDATRCDKAQNEEQLDDAGREFSRGISKAGVGTIMMILSVLGGRQGVKMAKGSKVKWNARGAKINDNTFGAPKKPKMVKDWEKNPDGTVVRNPTVQEVKPGSAPKLDPSKAKDPGYIWLIDENGRMYVAEEVQVGAAPDGYPKKLGHPTLVEGRDARIGGELKLTESGWEMNNKSGRYSNHPDRTSSQLENAINMMRESGLDVRSNFIELK